MISRNALPPLIAPLQGRPEPCSPSLELVIVGLAVVPDNRGVPLPLEDFPHFGAELGWGLHGEACRLLAAAIKCMGRMLCQHGRITYHGLRELVCGCMEVSQRDSHDASKSKPSLGIESLQRVAFRNVLIRFRA